MNKLISLLTTKRFLPLFITQFLGAFNDNVYRNALAVLIMFHITSISDTEKEFYSSIAIAIFMLPFFLFSATAGIIADKYDKAKLIKIVKFCEMIIIGIGVIGFFIGNIYLLFLVLFATGIQSAFFGPLKYAILPDHLKDNELLAGNSLVEAGTFLAIILGTVVGGVIISDNTTSLGYAGIVIFSLAACGYISTLFIPKTKAYNKDIKPSLNFIKDTISIIKIAKNNDKVFKVIIGISWFWLIGGLFMSQLLEITKIILTSSQQVYTLILTIFCIGIGIGSILCNIVLKGKISGKFVPICMLLISLFMIDFAYVLMVFPTSQYGNLYSIGEFLSFAISYRLLIDMALISFFGGMYVVPLYAMMQHDSDDNNRAKIIAANNIINALFMVFASMLSTILIGKLDIKVAYIFILFALLNIATAYYEYRAVSKKG